MIDKVLLDLIFQQIQDNHSGLLNVEDDNLLLQPKLVWAARELDNYYICVDLGVYAGSTKHKCRLLDLTNQTACCSVYETHLVTEETLMNPKDSLFKGFLGDLKEIIWAA